MSSSELNRRGGRLVTSLVLAVSVWAPSPVKAEMYLYVVSSAATLRAEPRENAAVVGKLPIGTRVYCQWACDKPDEQWRGVFLTELHAAIGDMNYVQGWIASELLSTEPPTVARAIAAYDQTAPEEVAERRKWAERAVALDPRDKEAQRRLLQAMDAIPDPAGKAAAEKSFKAYESLRPDATDGKVVLVLEHGRAAELMAHAVDGRLVLDIDPVADHKYLDRGRVFHFYADGTNEGFLVNEGQFPCQEATCPAQNLVRVIAGPGRTVPAVGIATNYPLDFHKAQAPTAEQIRLLTEMAIAMLKEPGDKEFRDMIMAGGKGLKSSLGVGQLARDGRLMLIGNWSFGSASEWFYEDKPVYKLFLVAEQQRDGRFLPKTGRNDLGCDYVDHADLNSDGTDEIIAKCEGVEGEYSWAVISRSGWGGWKQTSGPMR